MTRATRFLAAWLGGMAVATGTAQAQSTLDSPANLTSWVVVPGGLQFNLLHRFSLGPAPSRKLQNSPTLTVAYGLAPWLSLGVNYASASEVVQAYPNEWEYLARIAPLTQDGGAPVDVYLQGGYNLAAESIDGQLLLARRAGPLRATAGVGVLEDALGKGTSRWTVAGGATLRVHKLLGVAADISTFTDREDGEKVAWSAGLNLGITGTPHTLSVHASNVATRTLQGIAMGTSSTRYGFEYTIPISIGRYFGRKPGRPGAAEAARAPVGGDSAVGRTATIVIRGLQFSRGRLEIDAGTTVIWQNRDPLPHTVTSDSAAFNSGEIAPEANWSHTFTTPGTFTYHCTPHPHMKATVVVRPHP